MNLFQLLFLQVERYSVQEAKFDMLLYQKTGLARMSLDSAKVPTARLIHTKSERYN